MVITDNTYSENDVICVGDLRDPPWVLSGFTPSIDSSLQAENSHWSEAPLGSGTEWWYHPLLLASLERNLAVRVRRVHLSNLSRDKARRRRDRELLCKIVPFIDVHRQSRRLVCTYCSITTVPCEVTTETKAAVSAPQLETVGVPGSVITALHAAGAERSKNALGRSSVRISLITEDNSETSPNASALLSEVRVWSVLL